jgi:phosphoribosylaminoimidazole-succinocarboxamide synthase
MEDVLYRTDIVEAKLFKRGKVRDIYDLEDKLLIVATDRISCFDVVLPTPIPYKGKVLTQLSLFWFKFTKDIIKSHLISASLSDLPSEFIKYKDILKDRFMLVRKVKPLPVECVVRGYLAGSAFKEYRKNGRVCGIKLPPKLKEADKLEEILFTPATKAESGHDENITEEKARMIVGEDIFDKIKEKSIEIYKKASRYAESRGIIIADTKFEFGLLDDELIIIDEILTPDSSRFWPQLEYKPGKSQVSFDKQYVRDYLESIGWNKTPPAPALPHDIVEKTKEKYLGALFLLAGIRLD